MRPIVCWMLAALIVFATSDHTSVAAVDQSVRRILDQQTYAPTRLGGYTEPRVLLADTAMAPPYERARTATPVAREPGKTGIEVPRPTPYGDVFANCLMRWAYDSGDDGTIDRSGWTIYDERSHEVEEGGDSNGDGTIDYSGQLHYDADGNLTEASGDSDGDGAIDFRDVYHYKEGKVVLSRKDIDGDGVWDWEMTHQYQGPLLVRTASHRIEDDGIEVGGVETLYEYQDREIQVQRVDLDGDSLIDRVWEYVWGGGRIVRIDETRSNGRKAQFFYNYDERGFLIEALRDELADGTVDDREMWEIDRWGRLSERIIHSAGHEHSRTTYFYDVSGKVVSRQLRFVGGGYSVTTRKYWCPKRGDPWR